MNEVTSEKWNIGQAKKKNAFLTHYSIVPMEWVHRLTFIVSRR